MRRKPTVTRTHLFFGVICAAAFCAETIASSLGWRSSNGIALSALFLPVLGVCAARTTALQSYPTYHDELHAVTENSQSKIKKIEEDIQKNVVSLLQIRDEKYLLDSFKAYLSESVYPRITATISLIKVLGSKLHVYIQESLLKLILTFSPYLNYMYWLEYQNKWVDFIEYALDRSNVMGLKTLLETAYFQGGVIRTKIADDFKEKLGKVGDTLRNIPVLETSLGNRLDLSLQSFHVPYSFNQKLCDAIAAVVEHFYASRAVLLESLNALTSLLSSLNPSTHALSNPYFSLEDPLSEAQAVVKTRNLESIREYISNKPTAMQSETAGLVLLASHFVAGWQPLPPAIVELTFSFRPVLDLIRAGKSMLGYAASLLDVRSILRLLRAGAEFIDSEVSVVNTIMVKHLQEGTEHIALYKTKNGDDRTLFVLDRQMLRQTFARLKTALEMGTRAAFPQFVALAEKFLEYLDISDPYAQEKMRMGVVRNLADETAGYADYIEKKLREGLHPVGYDDAAKMAGYPLEVYIPQVGNGKSPLLRIVILDKEDVCNIWSALIEKSIFPRALTDEAMKFLFYNIAAEFYPFSRGLTQQILTANVGEMKAMVESAAHPQQTARAVFASMIDARNFTYAESETLFQFLGDKAFAETQGDYVHRCFFLDMALRLFEFPAALYYAKHFSAFLPRHYRDTLVGIMELLFNLIPKDPPEHFSHLSFSFEEENFTFPIAFRPKLKAFITELKRSNLIPLSALKEVVDLLKFSPNSLADEPTKRKKLAKKMLSYHYASHPEFLPPAATGDQGWVKKVAAFIRYATRFPQNIFFGGIVVILGWLGWGKNKKSRVAQKARQQALNALAQQKENIHIHEMEESARALLSKTEAINLSALPFTDLQNLHEEVEKLLSDVRKINIDAALLLEVKTLEKRITPIFSAKRPKQSVPVAVVPSGATHSDSARGEARDSGKAKTTKKRKVTEKPSIFGEAARGAGGVAVVATPKIRTEKDLRSLEGELPAEQAKLHTDIQKCLENFSSQCDAMNAEVQSLLERCHEKKFTFTQRGGEQYLHQSHLLQTRINELKKGLEKAKEEFSPMIVAFNTKLQQAKVDAERVHKYFSFTYLQELNCDTEFEAKITKLNDLEKQIVAVEAVIKILPTDQTLAIQQPRGEAAIEEQQKEAEAAANALAMQFAIGAAVVPAPTEETIERLGSLASGLVAAAREFANVAQRMEDNSWAERMAAAEAANVAAEQGEEGKAEERRPTRTPSPH